MTLEPRDMTLATSNYPDKGKPVWYMHPERTPLGLEDFQTPLKNICRYNGSIRWHLIRHLALGVLLCRVRFGTGHFARNIAGYYAAHDLHECIVGDVVSGMKKYLTGFREIENAWEVHTHEQIEMPLDLSLSKKAVRELDLLALVVEMKRLEHPAAYIAERNTKLTPTETELECFDSVAKLSDEDCWKIITDAIETAREELPWQQK